MDQNLMKRQRELTDRLNRYRNEYYNLNSPSVSDAVYDRLFEELQALEKQTGIQMANSPTSTVGYPAVSKLEKTNHPIPLLSLDKVKNTEELCRFMGEHQVMFMLKLDGLTVKLTYEGGKLVEAATRGRRRCGRNRDPQHPRHQRNSGKYPIRRPSGGHRRGVHPPQRL